MDLRAALQIIKKLKQENSVLRSIEVARNQREEQLRKALASQQQINKDLKTLIFALQDEIEQLKRQQQLDSHTSSKPPTSDGLKRKPRKPQSLRPKGNKKSGGQKGHEGSTLKQVAVPDKVILHEPTTCSHCNGDLQQTPVQTITKRQVFDIPQPKIEVTEHQAVTKCCATCRGKTHGKFPSYVTAPVQYGVNLSAWIIYLQHQQLLPEKRLQDLFIDMFGLPISTSTLSNTGKKFADGITPQIKEIEKSLKASPVKHVDETGFTINGKTCWLHVLSNESATCYRATEKRGNIIENLEGFVVHDHFKPYESRMPDAKHVFCNAHHLRELKALIKYDKELWAQKMFKLLQVACHIKNKSNGAVNEKTQQQISFFFGKYVQEGLLYHQNLPPPPQKGKRGKKRKRPGHNLLIRLQKYKKSILAFLEHQEVPFTNNQAERDLRMMKVKQKISGCFRNMQGAEVFCKIRSFISTVKKLSLNVLEEIATFMSSKRSLYLTLH